MIKKLNKGWKICYWPVNAKRPNCRGFTIYKDDYFLYGGSKQYKSYDSEKGIYMFHKEFFKLHPNVKSLYIKECLKLL